MMGKSIKSPFTQGESSTQTDPRFSNQEIELLKKLDEPTLRIFRSVFYQDGLTEEQLTKLKSVLSVDLVKVLDRIFVLKLNWNEPLFSMPNPWTNPRYEGVLCKEVKLAVAGRQRALEFMKAGVHRLADIVVGGLGNPTKLNVDIHMVKDYANMTDEEAKIETVAMQDAIQYLESSLMTINLYLISPEDKEEIIKRLRRDSSK